MAKELTIEELQAKLAESEKTNAELLDVIADLKSELAKKSADLKTVNKEHTVKHGSKTYKVVVPVFKHNGVVIEAKDLANSKDVVEDLVKSESGVLEEVVSK